MGAAPHNSDEPSLKGERFAPVCAVVMPMTLDCLGVDTTSEEEPPAEVTTLHKAFERFQPSVTFGVCAGPKTEFQIDYRFR